MSARPEMSSSVKALRVAVSTVTLPNTMVRPMMSSSGKQSAVHNTIASSKPGSVSMMRRVTASRYRDQLHPEEARDRLQFRQPVAGAERPVVPDPARRPVVGPLAGVTPDVDAARGVADPQVRPVDDRALRGDQRV